MFNRKLSRRAAAAAAVGVFTLAGGAGVVLAHTATYGFADEANFSGFGLAPAKSLAHAGITNGCEAKDPTSTTDPPKYCPNNDVSREQMAAFLERGLGRVEAASGDASTAASVTIDAGAHEAVSSGAHGYVIVTATWTAENTDTASAASVQVELADSTDVTPVVLGASKDTLGPAVGAAGSGAITKVVSIGANTSKSFTATFSGDTTATASITLTAVYVPFDGAANNDQTV